MPVPTEPVHIATQDIQRGSPAPKFEVEKPRGRRRSVSPISSSPSPSSSSAPSSSKMMYGPPPLTWRNAFQDAKAGVHYTKDSFPSSTFLPPPFSREPVIVEPGERVELLEEIDDYAVRVRVLRTGVVGLIPIWNTEGALERLTRINTAFNEAATCPVEARAMRRYSESSASSISTSGDRPTDVALTHIHARCIPYATRVRFPDYYGASSPFSDSDSDDDSDSPLSPLSPSSPAHTHTHEHERGRSHVSRPAVYEAHPPTIEQGGIASTHGTEAARSESGGRRKSVNFKAEERPQVVFRYPAEELVGALSGVRIAAGAGAVVEESEDDDEWWWQGWEEVCDSDSDEEQEQDGEKEEGTAESQGVARKLESVEEEVFPFVLFEEDA